MDIREHLPNGPPNSDDACFDATVDAFCTTRWSQGHRDEIARLMRDYIDGGFLCMDRRRATPISDLGDTRLRDQMPLAIAILDRQADAVCVFLEAGALDVTIFRQFDSELPDETPDDRVALFNHFAAEPFGGDPASLARFNAFFMSQRIGKALESIPSPHPLPAARRRHAI